MAELHSFLTQNPNTTQQHKEPTGERRQADAVLPGHS